MTAKPSRLRRLYMVLATVFLLAFFRPSPKTLSSKTVVALQHALGVDKSDVRVERRLRSNVEMIEKIDRDNEERQPLQMLKLSVDEQLEKAAAYFQEHVIKSRDKITLKNFLLDSRIQEWAKMVDEALPKDQFKAEGFKLSQLASHYGEEVHSTIYEGKKNPHTRVAALNLELALMMKWWEEGDPSFVISYQMVGRVGREYLNNPLWAALIKVMTEESKRELYKRLFAYFIDGDIGNRRLKHILEAKRDPATVALATELEKLQLDAWSEVPWKGDNLFVHLGLADAGDDVLKNCFWDTWVAYMTKLEGEPAAFSAIIVLLLKKNGREGLANLIDKGINDESTRKRAESLQHAFAMFIRKVTRKHLGKMTTPSKRKKEKAPSDVNKRLKMDEKGI